MAAYLMQVFRGTGAEWNAAIAQLPGNHLLQTWEWAKIKATFGWQMLPVVWTHQDDGAASGKPGEVDQEPVAAAMVLRRPLLSRGFVRRLCVLYAPKGPLLDWQDEALRNAVVADLEQLARSRGAIFLKMDPDIELGRGYDEESAATQTDPGKSTRAMLEGRGWRFSGDQVQFRNTVILDLTGGEAELLGRMKQKARYNVRLAERKGVMVRVGSQADIPALYKMYAETSVRDGFVIRQADYYRTIWETFLAPPQAPHQPFADVLIAEAEGQAVAAVFLFYFGDRAYYLYGMSTAAHREKMPNHLLQWKAILKAKERGCATYDLWGAPDEADETDPMWGVYRFKEGLGGVVVRTLGAWDFPASKLWYSVFTNVVPRVLDVMRARGRQQVRDSLAAT